MPFQTWLKALCHLTCAFGGGRIVQETHRQGRLGDSVLGKQLPEEIQSTTRCSFIASSCPEGSNAPRCSSQEKSPTFIQVEDSWIMLARRLMTWDFRLVVPFQPFNQTLIVIHYIYLLHMISRYAQQVVFQIVRHMQVQGQIWQNCARSSRSARLAPAMIWRSDWYLHGWSRRRRRRLKLLDASSFETPVQPEPPKSPPPPKCPLPPEVTPPMPPPDSPPPEIEDEPAFLPHMPSEKAPLSEESSFEEITAAFPQLKCAKKTASFQVGGMPVMKVAVSKAFPTLLQAAQEADLRRCALKKKWLLWPRSPGQWYTVMCDIGFSFFHNVMTQSLSHQIWIGEVAVLGPMSCAPKELQERFDRDVR